MPRPPSDQPTDGELEILRALWELGPSEIGAIRALLLQSRDIALTTVATMLKIMLEKRLVSRVQGERSWIWKARVSQRSAHRGLIGKLINRAFDGSASKLVVHLLEDGMLSPQEREQIRLMLDQYHQKKSQP